MQENCEEFTSLIQQMRNSKETIQNAWRKLEVPMPAAMPCKSRGRGRPVAPRVFARQNTHASLKPTNQRESVWKGLHIKIMKITLQGKGINSLNHYNLVHKFSYALKQ